MVPTPGTRVRFRSLAAALVVVLALWPLVPSAEAGDARVAPLAAVAFGQSLPTAPIIAGSTAGGIRAETIHSWLDALRFAPPADRALDRAGTSANRALAQRGYRGRRGRGDRGVAGLVLGAIGGFAAGGAIGAAVGEHYCHCDNPGLHGFIIGAPIGAVVGGFIGYALTR